MWTSEKRQRVTQACDRCKRRKKQCSGTQPCAACSARSIPCSFTGNPPPSNQLRNLARTSPVFHKTPNRESESSLAYHHIPSYSVELETNPPQDDHAAEDETPIQNPGRLLQNGEGRLLYVGDSSTLSFLQTIRRLVEKQLGPSPFTMDSNCSRILEATISAPTSIQQNYALPDREAAQFMIDSFFANTAGLFEIFDEASFRKRAAETLEQPLDAEPEWLCHLNLVFAIGLQMRKDSTIRNSNAAKILERLEGNGLKRAERFYLAARQLKDPTIEFEDGGMGVVQSLLLMTIYMLAASKRNTAWAFLGMAINLSYALGIHKEETLPMFDLSEQTARRRLWQSLYIMDCFLATTLGRPNTIDFETASELCSTCSQDLNRAISPQANSLLFSITASKIVGEILSRVYHKRKASRAIAYLLSLRFSEWMKDLPLDLHWRGSKVQAQDPDLTLRRLHINLIYFNGLILLTRPFFLDQITRRLLGPVNDTTLNTYKLAGSPRKERQRPEQSFCFHGACVRSALHSIEAIHAVFSVNALPRRDPFVIHWLFSAALVMLANMFCQVYVEVQSESIVSMALEIMRFCGDADSQAQRYLTILKSFTEVLQEDKKIKEQGEGLGDLGHSIFEMLFGIDVVGLSGEESSAESRIPVAADWAQSDGIFPPHDLGGLDALCFSSGVQGKSDDLIDGNDIWWNPGQDIFACSGDIPVPFYS